MTPRGPMFLAGTGSFICHIAIQASSESAFIQRMDQLYSIRPIRSDRLLNRAKKDIEAYLEGKVYSVLTPIEFRNGTLFQKRVWKTMLRIPYGETRSYQWIAKKTGNPSAVRAVGRVCGGNPIPIIVPCHRVIQKSGRIGGYTGGISMKKWLLSHEAKHSRRMAS